MMSIQLLLCVALLCGAVSAFKPVFRTRAFLQSTSKSIQGNSLLYARRSKMEEPPVVEEQTFVVGEDVPEEIMRHQAIYDMVLIERISAPLKTSVGLFLPKVEGKDRKHLGKVLSVPQGYGLESEQGRVQPLSEIADVKVGDVVYVRDPWGIGPMNREIGPRYFSFHKVEHITGIVSKA